MRQSNGVFRAHDALVVAHTYLSRAEWDTAFAASHLEIRQWQTRLDVDPVPARWVFGRGLHMIAALAPTC